MTEERTSILKTIFDLSATLSRSHTERVVKTSAKACRWRIRKSKIPPIRAAATRTFACFPPASPATRTSVVAVASGKGNSPCISFTKWRRSGTRKTMPSAPPRSDTRKSLKRSTGRPRMKSAGSVKIAPATTRPEAAPTDWTMTFSSTVDRRLKA
jgi:hypothetical protein